MRTYKIKPWIEPTPVPKNNDPEPTLPLKLGDPIPMEQVDALDPKRSDWAKKQGPLWRMFGPDFDGDLEHYLEKFKDLEGADERGYTGPLPIHERFPLREVNSVDEMGEVLTDQAQPDQLVVIKWFEEECSHCQSFEKVYTKLSEDEANSEVIFIKLNRIKARKTYNEKMRTEPYDMENIHLNFLGPSVMPIPDEIENCKRLPAIHFIKTGHHLDVLMGKEVTKAKLTKLLKKHRERDISEFKLPGDHPVANMFYPGAIPGETLEDIDPNYLDLHDNDELFHQTGKFLEMRGIPKEALATIKDWEAGKEKYSEEIKVSNKKKKEYEKMMHAQPDDPLDYERIMKDHMPSPEGFTKKS